MKKNNQKREELRKEYNKKVKEGKILPPSRNDNLSILINRKVEVVKKHLYLT